MKSRTDSLIRRLVQDSSLRTKMIVIFFVLLILPSLFFTHYATKRVAQIMQEQTFSAARKTLEETFASLQALIAEADNVIELLVYDDLIYTMVSADAQDHPYTVQLENARALSNSFRHLINLSQVNNIRLYVKHEHLYTHENRSIFSLREVAGAAWYQDLLESPSGAWFTPLDFAALTPPEGELFSSMRLIYDPSELTSPLAVLRVDFSQATLERALGRTATTQNAATLLLSGADDGGRIVLSSANEAAQALPQSVTAELAKLAPDSWGTIRVDGIEYYSYRAVLEPPGWQLAAVIPYSDIYGVSAELHSEMILVMLFVAAIAYGAALYLSNRTLRRIWQLAEVMQQVEDSDVNVRFPGAGRDEIGQLILHFNRMMDRVRGLMDEKVRYGQEIKNLELKALQAQINPHFLYNTLDTINCLAIQKDIPEIVDVVSALASFYRISLSKGRDQIPIGDEVRHCRAYLQIQNARFENRIHAVWEIDPEIEALLIIKIVLQPIIENAVIHGIYEREDQTGTILIRGWREDNDVYISVSDNGVGMPKEKADTLFQFEPTPRIAATSGGYGLKNISDRLKIAYGAAFGLFCESVPMEGTTVTIHIPAISHGLEGEGDGV